jgi:heme/copper-type cytochrome/quinol oxidase subunit 1
MWTPKIIGKTYNEFLGKVHFWTLFIGVVSLIKLWAQYIYFIGIKCSTVSFVT